MKFRRQKASSLVITLLVLVVLSTIVVAFMQSMAIERATARSYKNQFQLELALEAGKTAAVKAIASMTGNDDFIVVRNGDYTFIGRTTNAEGNAISYLPAFTSSTNATQIFSTVTFPTNTLPTAAAGGSYPASQARIRPFTDQTRTVTASLIDILETNNSVAVRYAYWVEDLGGKIDGAVSGNLQSSLKHSRPDGTNLSELALYTLFSSNSAVDIGDTNSRRIIENRRFLLSPKSYLQEVGNTNAAVLDEITFNIPAVSSLETIPYGSGYPDKGKAKYNLNYFATNGNIQSLADIISTNLPTFASTRKGALTDDYNRTLAANIIDYVDPDTTPSIGTGYRGVDSTPFVTIFHDKVTLLSVTGTLANVEARVFVQLWNPSDKPISGSFQLEYNNNDDLTVGVNTGTFSSSITSGYPFTARTISLQPNEISVQEFGPVTFQFNGGFGTPVPPFSRNAPAHTRSSFRTTWNGKIVDQTAGGIERPNGSLPLGSSRWTGGLPGLRHHFGTSGYNAAVANPPSGDPRQLYYMTQCVAAHDYDERTAWWGMAIMRPMPGRFMTDPTKWLDPAPNSARPYPATNSTTTITENATLTTINGYKSQGVVVLSKTNEAPFIFNNSGTFRSATELGNVFDPALWSAATNAATNGIPASAAASANGGGGFLGGASLRIGKPEHPKFDTAGVRAVQLLDLFGVDPDPASLLVKAQTANQKLNINTAGTNALRALIAGIQLTRDAAAGTVVPPTNAQAVGQWFADSVITRREGGPFLSVRELSSITNASGKLFGERAQWGASPPAATFKDVGMEELFAKVFDLATVKSRAFRIVVIGQVVNEKGKVIGTGTKEFHVLLQPQRNSSGAITNQFSKVFYEVSF